MHETVAGTWCVRATRDRRAFAALLLALAALLVQGWLSPSRASAQIVEFNLPSPPSSIAAGPDGNMWFTLPESDQIGHISPQGAVTLFSPGVTSGDIVAGPDGNMWFTEGAAKRIGRITPAGHVTGYPTPFSPKQITLGGDGNLWFGQTEFRIGRITPAGNVAIFRLPSDHRLGDIIADLATGPDGNIWPVISSGEEFVDRTISSVGPSGNVVKEANLEGFNRDSPNVTGLAAGPGGTMWVAYTRAHIDRINASGKVSRFSAGLPPTSLVLRLARGPDGNFWFSGREREGQVGENRNFIGRITPEGEIRLIKTPTAEPWEVAAGPDGRMWFTSRDGKLLRVDTALPPRLASKLEIQRATVRREERQLSVLAPITARASGRVEVEFHAAGRRSQFSETIDSQRRRIRLTRTITRKQAELGTGIVTLRYPGDDDTQPQEIRLRAASRRAELDVERPRIENGRVKAEGTISRRARGVVRMQLVFDVAGETRTLKLRADIEDGRFAFDEALSQTDQAALATRQTTVHSYTLFTGYFREQVRGEMEAFEVLPLP